MAVEVKFLSERTRLRSPDWMPLPKSEKDLPAWSAPRQSSAPDTPASAPSTSGFTKCTNTWVVQARNRNTLLIDQSPMKCITNNCRAKSMIDSKSNRIEAWIARYRLCCQRKVLPPVCTAVPAR